MQEKVVTSNLKWRFSPKRPSDKTRDPVAGEFFSSDAIKDAGEALVREAIQNSLDARVDRINGKARVRIYISGDHQEALPAKAHEFWFSSIWQHYEAPKNGLRPKSFARDQSCRFLVFEDFETTGLVGDREQYEQIDGQANPFFYFFRAEGATEKDKDRLGRWGIGKQVFPRASRAQTFFGYTETPEGGFLMGGSILKHHVVNQTTYKPDGFFGLARSVAGDELSVPTSAQDVLERFRTDFRIERKSGQHGLSVVVPWLDETEGDEARVFDRDTLGLAVIKDYFAPILEGRLEVELVDPNGSLKISAANYRATLEQLELVAPEKRKREIRRVRSHIELAEAARTELATFRLSPCAPSRAAWAEEMVTESLAKEVREALATGKPIAIEASLTVRPKTSPEVPSSFMCYIKREDQLYERPCHIRENLIISHVEAARVSGFSCLIRVGPGPLAELLGDSENPSHTEWQKSSRNFKDRYIYGGMTIDFVSNFASEFLRRVHSNSKQLDRKLLIDLFSDSGPEDAPEKLEKGPPKRPAKGPADPGGVVPPPPQPPTPPSPSVRVTQLNDGFTLTAGPTAPEVGSTIRVSVAYETTKGNPFKAYRPYDFALHSAPIRIDLEGCIQEECKANVLRITVQTAQGFKAQVRGFDVNRDLIVRTHLQAPYAAAPEAEED
jgi:hypothetical protein